MYLNTDPLNPSLIVLLDLNWAERIGSAWCVIVTVYVAQEFGRFCKLFLSNFQNLDNSNQLNFYK